MYARTHALSPINTGYTLSMSHTHTHTHTHTHPDRAERQRQRESNTIVTVKSEDASVGEHTPYDSLSHRPRHVA